MSAPQKEDKFLELLAEGGFMVDKTAQHYHPDMEGSVSIKAVLPAVWNNNP